MFKFTESHFLINGEEVHVSLLTGREEQYRGPFVANPGCTTAPVDEGLGVTGRIHLNDAETRESEERGEVYERLTSRRPEYLYLWPSRPCRS